MLLRIYLYIMDKDEEGMSMREQKEEISVLILCSFYSSYVIQLCEYMGKYYPRVKYSLLTHESAEEKYRKEEGVLQNIYYYATTKTRLFYHQIDNLPLFDIIHSLWMEPIWGINVHKLKKKAMYWFNSVGGSDLYHFSSQMLTRIFQKRIIRHSDWISSENIQTRNYFYKVYGEKYRNIEHSICRFGVDILDYIRQFKQKGEMPRTISTTFPKDKIIVLCGTNASENHQHFAIIDAISSMGKEQMGKCHFVFPMTYPSGKEAYIKEVSMRIAQVTNSFTVLTKYMDVWEMAELAMASDIMIHVQKTDQLSSVMLSHMYNGNVVLAGSWLPYDTLKEKNVFFLRIDEMAELSLNLEKVVNKIDFYKEKCGRNADIVYQLSSWEAASKEWMKVYTSLMKGEK